MSEIFFIYDKCFLLQAIIAYTTIFYLSIAKICAEQTAPAKNSFVNKEDFRHISDIIFSSLSSQPLPAKELMLYLGGVKKEKAWKVIELLNAEDKIEMDKSGWVRLK